jgi:hypothetical protein
MKKALDAAAVIATITIAGWNYQQNKEVELSDLAMENVEALANGESESNLDCEGLLGICSFECDKCGADWTAIGSTMKGSHTCQQ